MALKLPGTGDHGSRKRQYVIRPNRTAALV
jgi:hypothetical protein